MVRLRAATASANAKMVEALCDTLDNVVDPREDTALGWVPTGDANFWRRMNANGLREIRDKMRSIQDGSGIAIGAIEAVTDYTIGTGLSYKYEVPRGTTRDDALHGVREEANSVWDEFVRRENWSSLEQQLCEAADYEGEFFLRMHAGENGVVAVRFVCPDSVAAPVGENQWGIVTKPNDKQCVVGFIIDNVLVPEPEVVHLWLNVPPDVPRGIPSLWPVKDNVVRGDTITRNVAKLAALQAAIAMIRKHNYGITQSEGDDYLARLADDSKTNVFTGKPLRQQYFAGGSILDVGQATEVQLPASGSSLPGFFAPLLMNLRPIAVRLGLPDFVVTGDVSAANFASVFTSMAPSSKRLARKQSRIIRAFRKLHEFVLSSAVVGGMLPEAALRLVSRITGPEVANRDEATQTNKREVLFRNKVLSRQTWAAEEGYDADEEQANIESDETINGTATPGLEDAPNVPGGEGQPPAATSGSPNIDAAVAAAQAVGA